MAKKVISISRTKGFLDSFNSMAPVDQRQIDLAIEIAENTERYKFHYFCYVYVIHVSGRINGKNRGRGKGIRVILRQNSDDNTQYEATSVYTTAGHDTRYKEMLCTLKNHCNSPRLP